MLIIDRVYGNRNCICRVLLHVRRRFDCACATCAIIQRALQYARCYDLMQYMYIYISKIIPDFGTGDGGGTVQRSMCVCLN